MTSQRIARKDRLVWDRKDRRENNFIPTYRTIPQNAEPVPKPLPKKQSVVKDLDDMDNVEDFFDSDTEYPSEAKTSTFLVPPTQAPNAPRTPLREISVPSPNVYHRTPKFPTPVKTRVSHINSPEEAHSSHRSSLSTSRKSSYSSSSDFDYPLPPLPDTPVATPARHIISPSKISLKPPPTSPPAPALKNVMKQIDLDSVAISLAENENENENDSDKSATFESSRDSLPSTPQQTKSISQSIMESSTSTILEQSPQKLKKTKKKSHSLVSNKENLQEYPSQTALISSIASPFTATLLQSNQLSQESPSSLKLALDEVTDSFLSSNSDEEEEEQHSEEKLQKPISPIPSPPQPKRKNAKTHKKSSVPPVVPTNELVLDSLQDDIEIAFGYSLSEVDALHISKIRSILNFYKLPTHGRKRDMVERLRAYVLNHKETNHIEDNNHDQPEPQQEMNESMPSAKVKVPKKGTVPSELEVENQQHQQKFAGAKRKRAQPAKQIEEVNHSPRRRKRSSGNFSAVVDIIRQPDTTPCLPPSKRRKFREEVFPTIPVYSSNQDCEVNLHAVKNQSMLAWKALCDSEDAEESLSSDLTSVADVPERNNHPVHHTFAFNSDFFATGQVDIAPKQTTPLQNSRGSHEFFYVNSGTAEVFINKDTFVLKRGCQFYIPPMNNYYIKNPAASSYLSLVFFRSTFYDDTSSEQDTSA